MSYQPSMNDPNYPGGDSTQPRAVLEAGRLWTGGVATAIVAALIAILGVLLARGVLGVPLLAPDEAGAFGDSSTLMLALLAALAALLATGLMHVLLLTTPASLAVLQRDHRPPDTDCRSAAVPERRRADVEGRNGHHCHRHWRDHRGAAQRGSTQRGQGATHPSAELSHDAVLSHG